MWLERGGRRNLKKSRGKNYLTIKGTLMHAPSCSFFPSSWRLQLTAYWHDSIWVHSILKICILGSTSPKCCTHTYLLRGNRQNNEREGGGKYAFKGGVLEDLPCFTYILFFSGCLNPSPLLLAMCPAPRTEEIWECLVCCCREHCTISKYVLHVMLL